MTSPLPLSQAGQVFEGMWMDDCQGSTERISLLQKRLQYSMTLEVIKIYQTDRMVCPGLGGEMVDTFVGQFTAKLMKIGFYF